MWGGDNVLRLPVIVDQSSIPVGDQGGWEFLAWLSRGKPGRIEFAPGQTLEGVAKFFAVMQRAAALGIGAASIKDGGELALVAKRLADQTPDPLVEAALKGKAFCCKACGNLWASEAYPVEDCPACKAQCNHTLSALEAETQLGVDGPFTKMNEKTVPWF